MMFPATDRRQPAEAVLARRAEQAVAAMAPSKAPISPRPSSTPRCCAIKLQEDAGIDIVCDGEKSRQHFVHGFLEFVDGIDFANKVEMGIRANRYKAMVPTVRGELQLKGRVHQAEARHARAHTKRKLKITMPGPMTIADTIADAHYGDKIKMAMAFAGLLNQEARALEKDGVDVIQFDEPAFNVFTNEVAGWGIEALHRAIDGLKCQTAVHICYGYGIKANIDWKNSLGGEWRQYEEIFPALAKSRIGQVSLECINSRVPMKLLVAARRQGCAGRRHRCRDRHGRDAGANRRADRRDHEIRAQRNASSPAPIAAWRRCGAISPRPSSWRSAPARRWRGSATPDAYAQPTPHRFPLPTSAKNTRRCARNCAASSTRRSSRMAMQWEKQGFVPREVLRRMGELGFLGIRYPAEYGGSEMDVFGSVVLAEELGRCTFGGTAITVLVHTDMASVHMANAGSPAQKAKWMPEIIAGRAITAVAVTEPDAGSDVKGIRTAARRDGDAYVIDGAKMFITNGVHADLYFVAAKTRSRLARRPKPCRCSWWRKARPACA